MDRRNVVITGVILVILVASAFLIARGGHQVSTTTVTLHKTETVTVVIGQQATASQQSTREPRVFVPDGLILRPASWGAVDELLEGVSHEYPAYMVYKGVGVALEARVTPTATITAVTTVAEPIAAPVVTTDELSYSTTNVRVAGVDEYDIVKINGTHAFILVGDTLYTAKIYPVDDMALISNISIGEIVSNVSGKPLIAVNTSRGLEVVGPIPTSYRVRGMHMLPDGDLMIIVEEQGDWRFSRVILVKYSPDAGVVDMVWVTGYLVDTRLVGDKLVVVTNQNAYKGVKPMVDGVLPPPGSLAVTGSPEVYVNVIVLNTTTLEYSYTGVLGPGATAIYMTGEGNLYLAQASFPQVIVLVKPVTTTLGVDNVIDILSPKKTQPSPKTLLVRIDTDKVNVTAATTVDGIVDNTWQMDEYSGYLRVVADTVLTTQSRRSVALYILNASTLEYVSSLREIAVEEEVYGIRFMGDMLYLVTYRRVDPLFAINLSNPEKPTIIGYLKAPGFDNYLHPLGKDLLLGVGYENNPENRMRSIRLTIYNVSGGKPDPVARLYIWGRWAWTPLLDDPMGYRLFHMIPDKGIIIIPLSIYNETKDTTGFAVIRYSLEEPSLELMKIIKPGYGMHPIRSLHVNEVLYTISTYIAEYSYRGTAKIGIVITAYNTSTLEEITSIKT